MSSNDFPLLIVIVCIAIAAVSGFAIGQFVGMTSVVSSFAVMVDKIQVQNVTVYLNTSEVIDYVDSKVVNLTH